MRWWPDHSDNDVEVTGYAPWGWFLVRRDHCADDEVTKSHPNCTVNKEWATASSVNVKKGDYRTNECEDVIDARCDEVDVAGQICHLKEVDHVIGDNILFWISAIYFQHNEWIHNLELRIISLSPATIPNDPG